MFPAGSLLGNAAECVCPGGNFVACGSIAVPQVNTKVMLLPCQDPLLFSHPFQAALFQYSTLLRSIFTAVSGMI